MAIRAAKKAGDINLDKLQRQQRELEITTVAAQCRLGELTREIEKQPGKRTDITSSEVRTKLETKEKSLKTVGITKQRASEYERMAATWERSRKHYHTPTTAYFAILGGFTI